MKVKCVKSARTDPRAVIVTRQGVVTALDGCGKSICEDCVDSKGGGKCDMCSKVFCCSDCQYTECNKDWVEPCTHCTHAEVYGYR